MPLDTGRVSTVCHAGACGTSFEWRPMQHYFDNMKHSLVGGSNL